MNIRNNILQRILDGASIDLKMNGNTIEYKEK